MAYVDKPDATTNAEITRIADVMLKAAVGACGGSADPTVVSHAALQIAMSIWALGGATQEQARQVCNRAIELLMSERSN